ncbi:unknown [Corallococcus sp. CAG:1435]|nr:unknown [Corallococcus sp. CAG:1435]
MECSHCQLRTGFADGLCGNYAYRFAQIYRFARCHVGAVALAAHAVFAAAGKHRSHVQFVDARLDYFLGEVVVYHCVAMADEFARLRVDDIVYDVLADDTVFELFDNFVFARTTESLNPHTLRTASCRTVFFTHDNVLRNVHQTTCKVTGVCRLQSGVRQTFTSAVGGNEVFQHRQTFTEASLNGQFDGTSAGVAHQTTHAAQLTNLVHATTGAGIRHHPDGVVLFHDVFHQVFHFAGNFLPHIDNRLVAFVFRKETFVETVFDVNNTFFRFVQNSLFFRGNVHVEHACGKSADGAVLVAQSLYVVQHCRSGRRATQLEAFFHDLRKLFLAHQVGFGIGNHCLCQFHGDAQSAAFQLLLRKYFLIGDVGIVLGGCVCVIVVDCLTENHTSHSGPDFSAVFQLDIDDSVQCYVVRHIRFVRFIETAVEFGFAQQLYFFFRQFTLFACFVVQFHYFLYFLHVSTHRGEVVAAQNHVLRGANNGFAVGKFKNVVGGKHQESCFRLRFYRKGNVHCHLVAVEVGVECRTCQRVQFDGSAFNQYRFESLNGKTVQCRRTV